MPLTYVLDHRMSELREGLQSNETAEIENERSETQGGGLSW